MTNSGTTKTTTLADLKRCPNCKSADLLPRGVDVGTLGDNFVRCNMCGIISGIDELVVLSAEKPTKEAGYNNCDKPVGNSFCTLERNHGGKCEVKPLTKEAGYTPEVSPGEWRVLGVQGKKFIATPAYEGHPYFGHTRFVDIGGDEDYPLRDADITLMAASKELYEALQAVAEYWANPSLYIATKSANGSIDSIVAKALSKAVPK